MLRFVLAALASTLILASFANPASAVLITVSFTVYADPADGANTSSSGSFSFNTDDISIPSGGGYADLTSATADFDFTWDGTHWTDSTIPIMRAEFDAGGNFIGWGAGFNVFSSDISDPDAFAIRALSNTSDLFAYHNAGTGGVFTGSFTWSDNLGNSGGNGPPPGTASEAAGCILLGLGILGGTLVRRPVLR
jgi:hypothetical protein